MSAGWLTVVALVDAVTIPAFERILERHVSGLDATYCKENHALLVLESEADEVWFRLAALNDTTIRDIHRVGHGNYLIPLHLLEDVRRWLGDGLFEVSAGPLTIVRLELRDGSVLRHLELGLEAEQASFACHPPVLCPV